MQIMPSERGGRACGRLSPLLLGARQEKLQKGAAESLNRSTPRKVCRKVDPNPGTSQKSDGKSRSIDCGHSGTNHPEIGFTNGSRIKRINNQIVRPWTEKVLFFTVIPRLYSDFSDIPRLYSDFSQLPLWIIQSAPRLTMETSSRRTQGKLGLSQRQLCRSNACILCYSDLGRNFRQAVKSVHLGLFRNFHLGRSLLPDFCGATARQAPHCLASGIQKSFGL